MPLGLLFGSLATLVVAALLVPLIVLGFDGFLLRFHEIFFTGDTWRFSETDTLLRIYPEVFWQDTAKLAAALVVAQAVVVGLASWWWLRRLRARAAPSRRRPRHDRPAPPGRTACSGSGTAVRRRSLPRTRLRSFRAAVDGRGRPDRVRRARPPRRARSSSPTRITSTRSVTAPRAGGCATLSLEALREVAPELPTLDEALAFFVDEAPDVGLHVDLKLRTRLDELGAALERHGLEARTVVSGVHVPSLRAVGARGAAACGSGSTYPEDRLSISRKPYLWPIVSLGLASMRASVALRLPRLARRAGATAVMLQHRLVTASSVERAHDAGLAGAGLDGRRAADLARVVAAGVDGVITNDPDDLRGYTDAVNRGVSIAALLGMRRRRSRRRGPARGGAGRGCRRRHHDGTDDDGAPATTSTTTDRTDDAPPTTTATTTRPAQPKLIAAGVTIGGTLVGGLTVGRGEEAREDALRTPAHARRRARGAHRRHPEGARRDSRTSTRRCSLAARVKRPGYLVPLKVDVSRPKRRSPRRRRSASASTATRSTRRSSFAT